MEVGGGEELEGEEGRVAVIVFLFHNSTKKYK